MDTAVETSETVVNNGHGLPPSSPPVASQSSLTLHHLQNSRSQRILWLLEELEVPYEIKKYPRTAQGLAPEGLLSVNSLGKSPVVTDGDLTLAESGAIVEYIIAKYGSERAKVSEAGWIDNLYFTHYAEGSLQPDLVRRRVFKLVAQNSPILVRPIIAGIFRQLDKTLVAPQLQKHGKLIESHLTKTGGWFAGGLNITSADYMMSFCLETFISRDPENVGPKTKEYVKKIQARPAYKRALEKGGEYAYLVPS